MAEKIALELDVKTGKAVTNLGNLEKATQKLNKTIDTSEKETMTLQQQFDSLNKEIEEAPVNIRAMNKQIQQYQAIALEAGRTSPLGREAIKKAAALKDRYIDIQNEVNRLANDGVKLQAALDLGTSVVAGFTAFQGAMALSGVESEELRETMVKLQAAQSILMGVETLRKNLEKESTLMLVAKNTAMKVNNALTIAATTITKLFNKAVVATSFSFKALKAAILATGVGALVIGISSAISAISDWIGGSEELESQSEKTAKAIEAQQKAFDDLSDAMEHNQQKEIALAKLKGASAQQIRKLELEQLKQTNQSLIDEEEKTQKAIQHLKETNVFARQGIGEALRKLEEKLANDRTAIRESEQKIELKELSNLQASQKELADQTKSLATDAKKRGVEINKRLEKDEEARHKLRVARKEADAKDLEDFIEIEKMKRDHLLKNEELTKNERRLIRFQSEQNILDITKEFNEKLNAEKEKQQKKTDELNKKQEEERLKLEEKKKKAAQEELERAIALEDAKLQLAADGVNALINLTTAFAKENEKSQKRAFEINKRLQIAQAIIQTYQGANAIFAAAAANPKTVLFPAQPFIAAGLAIVNGLANVATISKQQFQSSSAGGGGTNAPDFSGGGGTAPQLSPVTNTSTLVPQEPTQVFVTETDITNTQNQVAVIQGQATLS